jgi:hypothetical protein
MGLVLLVLLSYFPSLDANLVADDFRLVGRLNFDQARQSLRDTVGFGRNEYRPVVAFSFALSNALWGTDPQGFHMDSLILHALNVVLLFSWLLLLTKSTTISLAAALLFAVHPIHHERVVWIAARDSLLSTLFVLAAIVFYTLAWRPDEGSRKKTIAGKRILASCSIGFFVLGLLSYEGTVIFPAVLACMEMLVLSQTGESVSQKLRQTFFRTLPYWSVLIAYVAWWLLLFDGKTGAYELSLSINNLGANFYRLLYQLFYGHQHLAGILYFFLILGVRLLNRQKLALVLFSVLFMLTSYIPFAPLTGFASRFAYGSAIGYSLLIAVLLFAGTFQKKTAARSALRHIPLPASITILFILAGYYNLDLQARISDWKTAGAIADSIPRQVKNLYPYLPEQTALVLAGIPRMAGHAYVYPLGLKASIERFYPGRNLQVFYGAGSFEEVTAGQPIPDQNTLYFQFMTEQGVVEEIAVDPR